jgi:site-specific DNA-methyltransferase (adenine-specific)
MMQSDFKLESKNQSYNLGSYDWHLPIENVQTWIVDPPYNIGYNYKSSFNDKMTPQEYSDLHYDFLELAYDSANDGGSFFLINYPEIIAEYYQSITDSRWKVHQWMTWVYPSNIGVSKHKFTRASRTVLWMTKGTPKVNIKAVTQPYKNPTDKRVRELIGGGSPGTNLYDWQEINLCKNVSKDKQDYVNQIPSELLRRLILTTSDDNELVADLMCGSGSTVFTAASLGRKGWGCDINENLIPIWQKRIADAESA